VAVWLPRDAVKEGRSTPSSPGVVLSAWDCPGTAFKSSNGEHKQLLKENKHFIFTAIFRKSDYASAV
jgi:hypothetical protein